MKLRIVIGIGFSALVSVPAPAAVPRNHSELRAFAKANPCPSSGKPAYGGCAGYVIDHMKPICLGGPDKKENMQWQTVIAAKQKDIIEKRDCSCFRKTGSVCQTSK